MQKLDPHTLFSIFEQGDEEIYREHQIEDVLKNPYVLMGMTVTGVENFNLIDKMYLLKHKSDYAKIRPSVKYKYYSKLVTYLTRINIEEAQNAYTIGEDFDTERCLHSLNEMLEYFQDIEEYERCAIIFKYIDLLYGKKLEVLF